MYVAERAVRRMFPPQGKPQEGAIYDPHGLDGVLAWMLPAVLRFLRCLHAIWEPQVSWGNDARLEPGLTGVCSGPGIGMMGLSCM